MATAWCLPCHRPDSHDLSLADSLRGSFHETHTVGIFSYGPNCILQYMCGICVFKTNCWSHANHNQQRERDPPHNGREHIFRLSQTPTPALSICGEFASPYIHTEGNRLSCRKYNKIAGIMHSAVNSRVKRGKRSVMGSCGVLQSHLQAIDQQYVCVFFSMSSCG